MVGKRKKRLTGIALISPLHLTLIPGSCERSYRAVSHRSFWILEKPWNTTKESQKCFRTWEGPF